MLTTAAASLVRSMLAPDCCLHLTVVVCAVMHACVPCRTTPALWTGLASSTGQLGEELRRLDKVEYL